MNNEKKVYINKTNGNLEPIFKQAMEWIGLNTLIKQDTKVFIKPNLTYPYYRQGVTTSPELIEILVKNLKKLTTNITIGESDGGHNSWKAEEAFSGHGLDKISEKYAVKLINLSKIAREWIKIKIRRRSYKIPLPSLLLRDVDVFISMPVPKVHCMTGVSLGMKNQWGCIPDTMRLFNHYIFNQAVCSINKAIDVKIVIGDAKYMLDKNGPMSGNPLRTDLLIVSNDLGAFELTCCEIMGIDPDTIAHLRIAKEMKIIPTSVDNIAFNSHPSEFKTHQFTLKRTMRNWIVLPAFRYKILTKLFYGRTIGNFLHRIFYLFKGKPTYLNRIDTGEE